MTPEGWDRRRIGELVTNIGDGGTPRRDNPSYFGGDVPWVVIQDIKPLITVTKNTLTKEGLDACSAKLWPKNAVILSTGATIGEVGIAGVPLATKQGITGMVCEEYVIPKFLYYLLQQKKQYLQTLAQGSTIREVRPPILKKIDITLPPKFEQKKIATILSSVDDAIQATQAVIDQTRRVKQGLLQQLLTHGIGHTRFKQTEIGEIPEEWKIHSLEELCTFSNGHGFKAAEWSNEGFPIIRIQNLNGSREFNCYSGKPESKWIVESGEFLFAWAGVKGVSFGPCIWNGPRGVLNQHIYRIRPKDGLDKRWLFETMKLITKKIEERAHGFKYNLLHVRKADITNQIVPVPPFEEQQKISKLSEEMSTLEKFNLSSFDRLNNIKRGLMQDLLTGRVRVKLEGKAAT